MILIVCVLMTSRLLGIFLFLVFQVVWKPGAAMSLTSMWCCVGKESSSTDEGLFLYDCTSRVKIAAEITLIAR